MTLSTLRRVAAILAMAMILPSTSVRAQDAQGDEAKPAAHPSAPTTLPAPSITQHVLALNGRSLRYTATAGSLPATANTPQRIGDMFYVAYTLDGENAASRPITFVFNGGPGAASAYLHLGAMGPKRVALNDDGTLPPPPGHLVANDSSWLPFTDLVFVDPIGTGYSRLAPGKGAKADDDHKSVWGVRRDLRTLGAFIRLYLARNGRWSSPKFIVGESYGGFRAAALPDLLEREFAISLNGTVLISPVIEFSLAGLDGSDPYRLAPWALRLPSFAATAWQQGKARPESDGPQTIDDFRHEAERFALGGYLTALAGGSREDDSFYDRLAHFTGLPADALRRMKGRIPSARFAKLLLRDSNRIISLYDGSVAGPDLDPGRPRLGPDPTFDPVTARIMDAFSTYVVSDLGFKTDRAYRMLNHAIARNWNWLSGEKQGYAGAADALKDAMMRNGGLGVFIAHGMFDLVTPYFTSSYIVAHMDLPPPLRRNVKIAVYRGGHMMYTHAAARIALARDAAEFFRATLGKAAPEKAETPAKPAKAPQSAPGP
jgi:carboxypeptidase C (cathepsin A)